MSGQRKNGVIVAQMGARMHYAVPVILHRAGMLEHFYTDLWVDGRGIWSTAAKAVRKLPFSSLRKWAGRHNSELPVKKVTSFARFGLEYAWRLGRARSQSDLSRTYLWAGRTFSQKVAYSLSRHSAAAVLGMPGSKELFEEAKARGLRCFFDQNSCPQLWQRLRAEEQRRWPGWEPQTKEDKYTALCMQQERTEQKLADIVLCPSEFVVEYVVSLGVPPDKIAVVPYGINVRAYRCERDPYRGDRPLRVLFVGAVNLMKGIRYLLEALRVLDTRQIGARLVGPIMASAEALARYRRYCSLLGPVPRSAVREHYQWADVFVLPSICEGSATVTYEALACGLPVITTPNAGSVVRDGIDGFIVPIRDAEAIAEKLDLLASNPKLLAEMSLNARERALEFSWERYGERLVRAVRDSGLE